MGKAARKPRPSAPKYRYWDTDGCWFCDTPNACSSCKVNKMYVADQKERKERDFRRKLKQARDYDDF